MVDEPFESPKLNVADLAEAKGIPPGFLKDLGVFDTKNAVCIQYGEGNRPRMRSVDADGRKKVWWASRKSLPIRPYGRFRDEVENASTLGLLLLVEGESDCWTAWLHGFPALGIPGATMTHVLRLEDITGVERVYVVEEADAGGRTFVDGIVRRFAELRQEYVADHDSDEGFPVLFRVRIPDGVNDLNDLHLLHRDDSEAFSSAAAAALADAEELFVEDVAVPDSANTASIATEEWSRPVPLFHFDPPPFPIHILPDWVREFVEAEAIATQTPPDLVGMLSLSAVAASIARSFEVEIRPGWTEPANIYTAVSMPSGSRKSAVFRDVVAPIEAEERRRIDAGHDTLIRAQEEKKLAEKRLTAERTKAVKDEATDADVIALAEQVAALSVPAPPRLLADDATPEALERLLVQNGGKIAVFTAEGDIFDQMQGRYSSSGILNLGVFLRGHPGDPIRTDRIGRATTHIERPALTIAVAVQPDVIYGLAARREFRGRGLTPRFLFAIPESNIGRRDVNPEPMPKAVRSTYEAHISSLLGSSNTVGPERSLVVKMTDEGRSVLLEFAREIEVELPSGGEFGDITEWGSKLVGATARISLLLHAADHTTDSEWWNTPIPAGTVERAIVLARYLTPHARAAFALMGTDLAVADAEHILHWIDRQSGTAFTVRDLFEGTKGRFKKVDALKPGLERLEDHGYIRFRPPPDKKGPGRPPSPTFDVNPYSQKSQKPHNTDQPLTTDIDHSTDEEEGEPA